MTSELFNLLNDLNNLRVKREEKEKLTFEEKTKIIDEAKKVRSFSLKNIAKILSITTEEIDGLPRESKR